MLDYKRHGARYRARRRAVDMLFEAETRDIDPVAIVEDRTELSRNPLNADWELFRLPAVDRQILRVAAWEILFNDEVDAPISIKEAVEMASEYSGAKAAPYINAVLDRIASSVDPNSPFFVSPDSEEDAEDTDQSADQDGGVGVAETSEDNGSE